MAPTFSVVIPTFNRARSAAAAVLSVLAQTERDFECFVVDDGSTDDTPRVLSALPKDDRLRILRMAENRGQHACRNHAIRQASGAFVTFLDSDDLYLPRRLAGFKRALGSRPAASFWFSNAYVRRNGVITNRLFDPAREIPQGKVPGWYAVGDRFLPYLTTNVAIRREAFDRFGLFRQDLRILEDTELYSRMLGGGLEVGAIPEPLAVRFLHDTQITRDYEKDYEEALIALGAANPPPDVAGRRKKELAVEVAGYLWKDLRPARARQFLRRELGDKASSIPLYWRTYVPPPLLRAAKAARAFVLAARYSSALAPAEFREAERTIAPFLESAARL